MNARLALAILIGLCSSALGDDDAGPAKFKITTKRPDDAVDVRVEKETTVVSIKSPTGISRAVIQRVADHRAGDKWPQTVVLRLHLKGLEHFRATAGKLTLEAAVSSHDSAPDGGPVVRVWKNGQEDAPLDENSPCWIGIRIMDADGKAAGQIPLQAGYFELTLPRAFFERPPQSIELEWIEFYRT